jgi:6-phosphogluconolactonase
MRSGRKGLTALWSLLAMTSGLASAHAASYVYVSNADSKDITVLSLNAANGDLAIIETATVATGGPATPGSMPLAISPNKKFLYAALRFEPYTVVSFAIDAKTGKLQQLGTAPLPDSMAYIATDRTGKHLLSASYGGHKLSVSPIGAQGTVMPNATVIPTGKNAHAVLTDPSNKYLFATNLGSDAILQRKFNAATGAVSDNAPAAVITKPGSGPRHFVFHPNGKFFYLLNELDASLNAYTYNAGKGTLGEIQSVSTLPAGFSGKPWAADLHITPNGRFLYGTERTSSTIAGFTVDAKSGKLTPIGNVETEKQPRGFAIDPKGRYLLAVGQQSNGMSVYTIDPGKGTLNRIKQLPVGKNPQWVEIVEF